MTSVLVTTYNDTSAPAGYATIYSIDSSQEKISSKAAFHLAKNTVVDLDPIITGKGFSENELSQIGKNKATFEVVRTSITVQNILVRRVAASTTTGMFMFLIYLQQKSMRLTNVEFYVTGSVITANDPLSVYFENVYVDTYNVRSVFDFTTT